MKRRFLMAAVLGLIYGLAMLIHAGHGHHHESASATNHDRDCEACVWALSSSADVPPLVDVPRIQPAIALVVVKGVLPVAVVFSLSTASRAPPETLA